MHGICTEVLPGNLPIIIWFCFCLLNMFFHVFEQKNMLKC